MLTLLDNQSLGTLRPLPERPDLRRDARHNLDARAWLRTEGGASRVRVRDLSSGGALVTCDGYLRQGTSVQLRCYIAGAPRPLTTWARAVRSRPLGDGSCEIGLRFEGLPTRVAERIETYFTRYQPQRTRPNPYGL